MSWRHARQQERYERLAEAVRNGYIAEDELMPDDIHIPDEPDRKWTDEPREAAASAAESPRD